MKTAIYIENGLLQVVLTPESTVEEMACTRLLNLTSLEVKSGSFYACQGGWVRHDPDRDDKSTIFVCRDKEVKNELA